MSLAVWIRRCAEWHPQKLALVSGARRYTYREFNERTNRLTNALVAAGVGRGDRVAVISNNAAEAVEALGSAAKGGFVHVPISFRLSPREVSQILRHSDSKVVIVESEFASAVDAGDVGNGIKVVRYDPRDADRSEYESWLAAHSPDDPGIDVTGDDDFLLIYTSGTTGSPKGAFFQQRQCIAHAPVAVMHYELHADAKMLMVYPHNSIATVNGNYVPAWMLGCAIVLSDARGFSAERWLAEVQEERITHSFLVPTMLIRVLDSGAVPDFDVSTLETVGYGSAAMPRHRVEQLCEVFGDILVQGYGMTEISALGTVLSKKDHRWALENNPRRLASCGRPVFGCEVRVVDDEGRDVKPGEQGEVIFRGPQLTSGYWNDPVKTAETIREGGWLYSGDVAEVDEDGYVYIVDRKNDIIISGGYNISSKEVEEVLCWHEAVAEAAVVARPDHEWGERVHAFVVLRDSGAIDEAGLVAFAREHLARMKCPDRIEFVEELTRNALGKLVKGPLRERARQAARAVEQVR